jgi:TonB-linked SusC/RagA family outer membrane protein
MNKIYSRCLGVLLLSLLTISAYAQKIISGTVKDNTGSPIPAVSILIKGTQKGVSTDANGKYSITAAEGSALVFRYLGYKAHEAVVGAAATIDVILQEENNSLNEVVVTALGIKREKKSLGYAVQEVKGASLVEAREPNLVNSLSGKVAGLQITRSSNGPAGSSKITLRGNNSLTGDNQPLIVVDGVPLNNFTGAANNDYWNPSLDMGNGMSDINAEDIESVSVLKGPASAALYGSRAGNGAILITTKSGKMQKGLGITVSSSLGIESIFTGPQMQSSFGQGSNGQFADNSNLSWGPKAEGQMIGNWDGQQVPMSIYDNVGNYFDQGISSNQSVSFQQQYKNTSIYSSFNRLDDKSMIPGTKLSRTNLMARAVSKFGKDDRWTVDTKVQYSNSNARNRPLGGANSSNAFYTMYMLPRSLDIRQFSEGSQFVNGQNKMIWYGGGSQVNPYWGSQYNLNQDVRDRFIMNGSLKYKFNDWLNAEVKAGADTYYTNTETKVYGGSPLTSTGRYSLGKQTFTETNYSFLMVAAKDNLFGKLGGSASIGGNIMQQKGTGLNSNSGELVVPDMFSLNNGVSNPTVEQIFNEKRINSLYGMFQINWDGYLYLDATLRNDWTSTLHPDNRSYFYPSISTSLVFTEMIEKTGGTLPAWLSYGKFRASYAQVGNDLVPYQLYNTFNVNKDPNGNTTASRNRILFNPDIQNEFIKSFEVGTEMRFFNGRFGFDVAWYKTNATRQLIDLPMDPLSGYSFRKINAGDIQNSGIEAMVDANVLQNENSVNWNLSVNFSNNKNKVKALADDITQYKLGGYDDLQVLAVAGANYGEIYGSTFARVTDQSSPYFGQLLLNENGLPLRGEQNVRLGNQQASSLLGITNTFRYKDIGLSFLVDARFGGKIFSGTLADMQQNGTSALTAPNGSRDNFVVDGVILDQATNQYTPNSTPVTQQLYWNAVAGVGNMGITEANLYDASNIRLRNVTLSYNLPAKFLAKTPVQRAKIGFSVNNVWLISSHLHGIDPESVFATGSNATGFENGGAPTNRSYLFNLTVGF